MTMMRRRADGQIVPLTEEEIAALQPTLEQRRTNRLQEVEELRDLKLSRYSHDFGPGYGVLNLQLRDNDDRTNWLTLRTTATDLILAGMGESPVLAIRTDENVTIPMNALQVSQVMGAMAVYGGEVLAVSWALKDAIKASDDPESIDITQGWPA